jgi:hypothetical protein
MSSTPESIPAEGDLGDAQSMWTNFYAGPRAPDGHALRMLTITAPNGLNPEMIRLTPARAHALADWLVRNGFGAPGRMYFEGLGRFTCPRCWQVSNNPEDLAHGYCGRCHDWTAG